MEESDFVFGSDGSCCEDSCSDAEDNNAHAKLVADIQAITKIQRRNVASSAIRCIPSGSTGIDLGALAKLKKALPTTDFQETAPSSKLAKRRADRIHGYQEVAEEVNKWQGIVNQQRQARQVTFPLVDNSISLIEQDKQFKPLMKTDLEKEMYELLSGAKMIKSKQESAEEKEVREAMSLEEVLERNRENWRLRTLRDKIGKKAFLRNKTKSKKFHRVLKKDRLKQQANELEHLQKTQPGKALEKIKKLEDIRIEERMSLKHKKSKWAASLQTRAKTDKMALAALQENSRIHNELVEKLKKDGESSSSSSDDTSDSEEEAMPETEAHNATPASSVADQSYIKMKKFWGEYNKQKEEEVKDHLEQLRKQRKQARKSKDAVALEQADRIIKEKLASSSLKDGEDDKVIIKEYEFTFNTNDRPDDPMSEVSQRLRTLEDFDNMPTHTGRTISPPVISCADKAVEKEKGLPEVDVTKIKVLETKLVECNAGLTELFNDDSDGDADEAIFDEDDLALEQFNKEKADAEEASKIKDVCYALPGWGDWTGPSIKMSEKKKKFFTEKAPVKPPSKFNKQNLIYNEKADMHENIRNRMVSELPYPFLRVSDWEASIRGPVGRIFVPELVHRQMIEPAVVTKLGTVIKPMDKSQLVDRPEVQEAVTRKLNKMLDDGKERSEVVQKRTLWPGDRIMDLGKNKKRKFSRKSVK